MPAFILGLIFILIAIQGNANNLLTQLKTQKGFIPWLAGVGGLWALWNYAPASSEKVIHGLILASILGIVVVNISKVQQLATTAENAIKTL